MAHFVGLSENELSFLLQENMQKIQKSTLKKKDWAKAN